MQAPLDPGGRRRLPRLARISLVLLGSLTLTMGVGEAAGRMVQRLLGSPWSAADAQARLAALREDLYRLDWRPELAEERGEDPAELILHPYVGFDTVAAQAQYVHVASRALTEDPDATYDIVVVGGSVSCLLVQHSRARIVSGLRDSPRVDGRRVNVHVLGQGGLKQPQQLMVVSYALAMGWRPDVIINVDGFNELALGNYNAVYGAHPLHPSVPHWAHLVRGRSGSAQAQRLQAEVFLSRERAVELCDRALALGLMRSAVLGPLAQRAVQREVHRFRRLQASYVQELASERSLTLHGPPYVGGLHTVLRQIVMSWMDCSVSLAAICRARGIDYLHVLQPTLHDEGSKPLTKKEREGGETHPSWVEACRRGYPMLRTAGKALLREGVHFLDASLLFADVEEDLYYDECHFTEAGSDLLADAIVAELQRKRP